MKTAVTRAFSSASRLIAYDKAKVAIYSAPRSKILAPDESGIIKTFRVPSEISDSTEEMVKLLESSPTNSESIGANIAVLISDLDQNSWKRFVGYLNPQAASNLRLENDRDLIDCYNLCIPDPSSKTPNINQERIIRNRSKAIGIFPLFAKIMSGYPHEGFALLSNFDEGNQNAPVNALKSHLKIAPEATTGFMKRIAHAPSEELARNLNDILLEELPKKKGGFDYTTYNNRIADIPLYHNDREAHDAMWKVLENLNDCGFDTKTKSKIFFKIKENWVANANEIAGDFRYLASQYASTIADDLILPAYFEKLQEVTPKSIFFKSSHSDKLQKFEDDFTYFVRAKITNFVNEAIVSELAPIKLVEYAKRLDSMAAEINKSKPLLAQAKNNSSTKDREPSPQWHKIFPDQEINGIKFRVLTSDRELKKESEELENCIASFSQRCHYGFCHIVSVSAPDGERCAIRYNKSNVTNCGFEIGEINGIQDERKVRIPISAAVMDAVQILEDRLNKGEIRTNPNIGSLLKDASIGDVIGFEISNKESVKAVFESYRDAKVLPVDMKNMEEFYRDIGLGDFLKRVRSDIGLPSSEITRSTGRSVPTSSTGRRDISYLD